MVLDARGIAVRLGGRAVLSDVDVSVADGEVLGMLGPSGCGKSTLLRALAGLQVPAAGAVRWDGAELARVPVHRRGFGMVFQGGQLFEHRDVAGNVEFGLRMAGIRGKRRAGRVGEVLELVGLSGYERRRISGLSGGEQQRVALARALAPQPRLLLLDEPLSALDSALRERLAVDLSAMLRRTATTAIVVTHDHDEAFTLADRVAVMLDGRIRQVAEPGRLWGNPADEEIARFLGCGCVLPAEVRSATAECALGRVPVDVPDGPVRLGLRASGLRAEPDASGSGAVRERVHRRDHARLVVQVAGVGEVEAVADTAGAPEPGEKVRLRLDPNGTAVLPAIGARINGSAERTAR